MGESVAYCICRSSDTSRFMIGCDSCNEWYHGDCISITEELAKTITKFYCLLCRDHNPFLAIEYTKDKSSGKQGTVRKKKQQSSNRFSKVARMDDGSSREVKVNFIDDDDEYDIDDDRDETYKIENELSEKNSHKKSKNQSKPKNKKQTITRSSTVNKSSRSNKSHRTREKERERELYEMEDNSIRQCYGPGCVNIARRSSKYCSDDCGIKLAQNRMFEILPSRLPRSGSAADAFSHREMDKIRKENEAAMKYLEDLDVKQKELDSMIAEAKKLPPISEEEAEDSESGDAELMIYCVTCGHEIASSTAMRHMERCFNKFESQISYFGANKTKVSGVFCDVFNAQQRTYCMRLKVLCPEHTKEQRISDSEVCGCPLVTDCFELTGTFCRLPKKKCMKHYCWEKLRQAQLDMEKVQKWFKLEELLEKESKLRNAMLARASVLNLMLHKTDIQA